MITSKLKYHNKKGCSKRTAFLLDSHLLHAILTCILTCIIFLFYAKLIIFVKNKKLYTKRKTALKPRIIAISELFSCGRGSRNRTHGTWFWRPLLYQLSYTPVLIWWTIRDSNPGPTGYEPVALTI